MGTRLDKAIEMEQEIASQLNSIDCGKPLFDPRSLRCRSCDSIRRSKDPEILRHLAKISKKGVEAVRKPLNYCIDCGTQVSRKATRCRVCAYKTRSENNEWLESLSKAAQEYYLTEENKERLSEIAKAAWEDGAHDSEDTKRKKSIASSEAWTDERKRHWSQHLKRKWRKKNYRLKMSKMVRELWQDEKHQEHIRGIRLGESNPNWKGGASFEPYPPEFNVKLKTIIRTRDNYICVICGVKENSHAHDIHHIDYDKYSNELANLITLCHACHSTTNGNRDFWHAFLTLMIKEIYAEAELDTAQ